MIPPSADRNRKSSIKKPKREGQNPLTFSLLPQESKKIINSLSLKEKASINHGIRMRNKKQKNKNNKNKLAKTRKQLENQVPKTNLKLFDNLAKLQPMRK